MRPPGAAAFHFVNVNADFARQAPHVRRGRNRLAMFGAGNFAQLHGHAEYRATAVAADPEAAPVLPFCLRRAWRPETRGALRAVRKRVRPVRCVTRGFGLRGGSAFQREDHLSDFDLLAFFYFDFFDDAADRRRNFDHGFVGFEFHDRLAFGNFRAGRDHQPHQIALGDVLSEFGELEFAGAGGDRNSCGSAGRYGAGGDGAAA